MDPDATVELTAAGKAALAASAITLQYEGPAPLVNDRLIWAPRLRRLVLGAKYRDAKDAMAYTFLSQYRGAMLRGPVAVTIEHESSTDVDAPLKGILDALETGGIIADDKQVRRLCIVHHPGKRGYFRCTVALECAGGPP